MGVNKFPREDRNPRQYIDAWTTCTRCKKAIRSYDDSVHYIDGFPYCDDCYQKVKALVMKKR
jgi:hypothetical protein